MDDTTLHPAVSEILRHSCASLRCFFESTRAFRNAVYSYLALRVLCGKKKFSEYRLSLDPHDDAHRDALDSENASEPSLLESLQIRWFEDAFKEHGGDKASWDWTGENIQGVESSAVLRTVMETFLDIPDVSATEAARFILSELDSLAAQERRVVGDVVPVGLASCMAALSLSHKVEHLCDPFCTCGELLAAAALQNKEPCTTWAVPAQYSKRLSHMLQALCASSFKFTEDPLFSRGQTSLAERVSSLNVAADVVLTCLPQNGEFDTGLLRDSAELFPWGLPSKNTLTMAALSLCLKLLAPQGRAVLLCGHGILFHEGEAAHFRMALIGDNLLDSIIFLPSNVLYATSAPMTIMIFDNQRIHRPSLTDHVFFVDARELCRKGKNLNVITAEHSARITTIIAERKEVKGISRRIPCSALLEQGVWTLQRHMTSTESAHLDMTQEVAFWETELEGVSGRLDDLLAKLEQFKKN